MKWITRERIRTDRVASAWLIRRFVDPAAEFLFVPGPQVMERAAAEGATPFHVPEAELGQHERQTGFDAILAKYKLGDAALRRLAGIVRAADKKGDAPEAAGLNAVIHGFFLMNLPDPRVLELQLPLWDAVYRYCQDQVAREA